jgi:hypothetical protein
MLITPRTYSASQTPDQTAAASRTEGAPRFYTLAGWRQNPVEDSPTADMLLVHQTGTVRVGEIIRWVLQVFRCLQALSPGHAGDGYQQRPCVATKWSYNERS